jgi:hypothetical protein
MLRLLNETLKKYTHEHVYLHNSHKHLPFSFLSIQPPLPTSTVTGPTLQPLAQSRSSSFPRRSCLTFSQASFNRSCYCLRRTPHSRLRTIEQVHSYSCLLHPNLFTRYPHHHSSPLALHRTAPRKKTSVSRSSRHSRDPARQCASHHRISEKKNLFLPLPSPPE